MTDEIATEVEIKQDAPPAATDVVIDKAQEKPEAKIVTPDEGVEGLKAQVERAKADSLRRQQEGARQIAEARQRAEAAERERDTVKVGAVSTVIDSLQKDKDAAKRDLRAAHEAGDFDKIADAQERLATAAARIVEAERGKVELEAEARKPRPQAQPVFADNVEKVARGMQTQRAADWVRSHPQFVRGDGLSSRVLAAHEDAIDNGIEPETNAYYDHIEQSLGLRKEAPRREERDVSRAPTSAPVGRDVTQSPAAQRPGVVRLTASEVATAKALDMTLESYARHKQALIEQGKIGRMAS